MIFLLAASLLVLSPQDAPAAADSAEPSTSGYTLVAPLQSNSTYLFDGAGEVAHEWVGDFSPGNAAYLLPNGNLLRCVRVVDNEPFRGGGIGGRVTEVAPSGEFVWDVRLATEDFHHHHDIEPLPNGNFLAIVWEKLSEERALQLGRKPETVGPSGFWVDAIYEIEPVRGAGEEEDSFKIVWRWSSADHLVQDVSKELLNFVQIPLHPGRIDVNADVRERAPETDEERKRREKMERDMRATGYAGDDDDEDDGPPHRPQGGPGGGGDWLHTNSVDYHAGLDLIVLSVRSLGEVWVLDHSTTTAEAATGEGGRYGLGGRILYRYGNPQNYGQGDDSDRLFFGQHDATWVEGPDGSTHLLLFENGSERRGKDAYSTVLEFALPFVAGEGFQRNEGEPFGPKKPFWSWNAEDPKDFFASFISGAQRLKNGRTLVCDGPAGRLFELTPAGEVAWEWTNTLGGYAQSRGGRPGAGPPRGGPPGGGRPGGGRGP